MKASSIPLLALVLWGCSSGSSAPGAENALAAKKLSELTPAERDAFCSRNQASFASVASGSCVLVGLDAPTQAECDMAASECRSAGVATVCGGDGGGGDFTDCSGVTVGAVESCLGEAKSYFSSLACDAVGHATSSAPSCLASIEASCPVLLGAE